MACPGWRAYSAARQVLPGRFHADVAQLVEQLIRNQQVRGSSPRVGTIFTNGFDMLRLQPSVTAVLMAAV